MRTSMTILLVTVIYSLSHHAFAESEILSKGEIRMESRFFNDDNLSTTQDFGYGLASRLEVDHSSDSIQSRLQAFSRIDRKDPSRQRLNIEELYSQWIGESWVWFAGFKTLNWSTAEAFHPSDVVNSRNFDGPFENAEKLGELMAGFQYLSESVNFYAHYMPALARPQLPAQSNRLSFAPAAASVGQLQFVNNDGEFMQSNDFVNQWALRTQIPLDDWEFNFYWVHHFDRTDFKIIFNPNDNLFTPVLSQVDHYAFSVQYVWESWIFKSENAYRSFQENTSLKTVPTTLTRNDYGISSLAIEYMLSHSGGSDTTIIAEFQAIYGVDDNISYTINPFQRDLLLGARYAFNDVYGKEIFFGIISDVQRNREILVNASYTQRISDVWKFKVAGRYIDAPPQSNLDFTGIRGLNNDHQLDINISRFF